MKSKGSCDTCSYYIYDAEYDTYFCDISLDEDEMYKFLTDSFRDCPYYLPYDEYKISGKAEIRQNGAGCLKNRETSALSYMFRHSLRISYISSNMIDVTMMQG